MNARSLNPRTLLLPTLLMVACGAGSDPSDSRQMLTAGRAESCAIDADQHIWCWGRSVLPSDEPVDQTVVAGMARWGELEDAVWVSNDYGKTCAVSAGGELWCENVFNEDGLSRVDGLDDLVQVDVGGASCALRESGEVLCSDGMGGPWEPVEGVVATDIAGGLSHMCALTAQGEVWCWGNDSSGQLGDGDGDTDGEGPVKVSSDTPFVSLSANYHSTCAIDPEGQAFCWGGVNGRSSPWPVRELTGVERVAMSTVEVCAIRPDGAVRCWAGNGIYERGIEDGVWIDGSVDHLCVLRASGQVSCWGANDLGQSGAPMPLPSDAVHTLALEGVTQISGRDETTCARTASEGVWCWGGRPGGPGGPERIEEAGTPDVVEVGPGSLCGLVDDQLTCLGDLEGVALQGVRQASAGTRSLCVLRDGEVECLGHAAGLCASDGVKALSQVEQLSTGDGFACVLQTDGRVSCWGDFFEPGDPPGCVDPRPVEALAGASSIASAYNQVCGLFPDGVRCVNRYPRQAGLSLGGDFSAIWRGAHYRDPVGGSGGDGESICAITREQGQVQCVGGLDWAPEELGGVAEVAVGQGFACALSEEGQVVCWGRNASNQLGDIGVRQVEDPWTFELGG